MNDVGDIIRAARENQRWTQEQVAEKMGISLRQYNKYEAGFLPKYKSSVAEEIDKLLGTNIKALIYEQNVPHEKGEIEGMMVNDDGGESYREKLLAIKNSSEPFLVPLVPVKAQAGYAKSYKNTDFLNKLKTYPILPGIDPHGTEWRYFEVEGDSMEDTFKNGQYVLANQIIKEDWRDIQNYYVYVIITDEKVMIKRLAKVKGKDYWAAISDNEDKFKQFKLPVADVRELWKYRRHIDWDASPPKKFEVKV